MILMLLISLAFGQTGSEPTYIPNSVQEWCISNAKLKKQLVDMVTCRFEEQTKAYALPSVPTKRYVCQKYPLGISPSGYEGKLICPDPFGNTYTDASGVTKPAETIFQCAVCYTSNNTTGVIDADCKESMWQKELGMCTNDSGKMRYRHEEGGLLPGPSGEVPSAAEQNVIETPLVP